MEASEMDNLVDDLINDFEGNPINRVSDPSNTTIHKDSAPAHEMDDVVKADTFRSLPDWFFLLAFLNLFASLLTAALLKNGYLVIYGIGSMLTCLAFGRVIELLQNIDDELYRKRLSESP